MNKDIPAHFPRPKDGNFTPENKWDYIKYYTNRGWHLIAIAPLIEGIRSTGKTPSVRTSVFKAFDENGYPTPIFDKDGKPEMLDKGKKVKYAIDCGGSKAGTTDLDRLEKIFFDEKYVPDRSCKNLNLAVVTGNVSGVVILDEDGPEAKEQIKRLEEVYGKLPETQTCTTGREEGGTHRVYCPPRDGDGKPLPVPSKSKYLAPNIDIKGEGGYALVEPSMHRSGNRYHFDQDPDNTELAELPMWVYTILTDSSMKWDKRVDGLFEDYVQNKPQETKTGHTHKRKSVSATVLTGRNETFYLHSTEHDTVEEVVGTEREGTYFVNCPWHNSQSQTSLHIDEMGDHFEWYCHGCQIGGRAYTESEHQAFLDSKEFTEKQDYNHSLNTDNSPQAPTSHVAEIKKPDCIDTDNDFVPWLQSHRLFDYDNMPEITVDFIKSISKAQGLTPDIYGLSLLTVFSGAIGTTYNLHISDVWWEPANLWHVVLMNTGDMKTPVFNIIDDITAEKIKELSIEDEEAHEDYEMNLARYEKAKKRWIDSTDDNIKQPARPKEPFQKDFILQDLTYEAAARLLSENYRGIQIKRDEILGFIDGMTQYNGGTSGAKSFYLEGYNSRPYKVTRASRHNLCLPRNHISIFGFGQLDLMKKILKNERHHVDGFSSRFLVVRSPNSEFSYNETPVSPRVTDDLKKVYSAIVDVPVEYDETRSAPISRELHFTPDATRLWRQYMQEITHIANNVPLVKDRLFSPYWNKHRGQVARLALVIHRMRYHSLQSQLTENVDEVSLRMAIGMGRYALSHAFEILYEDTKDPIPYHDKIRKWCREHKKPIPIRMLLTSLKVPNMEDALEILSQIESRNQGFFVGEDKKEFVAFF